jgi:cytosine/adenosine deaminase-related metal-dependent hydrolase
MAYVDGMIYQESGFIRGYLEFEAGEITKVVPGRYPTNDEHIEKGVVLPLLTNCHIHIGDAIAYGKDFKEIGDDIESLVAPPDGLKFQILRSSKPEQLINSMRQATITMLDHGIGSFIDFREEGLEGVGLLKEAVVDLPINPFIMGRPKELKYSKTELSRLLPMVDGIGVSSISDWEYSELMKISKTVKAQNKLFALHASERLHEDLDLILALKPDFLVHMTFGTDSDFKTLAELEIPVVLCPRSNIFFNKIPDIPKMLSNGVKLVLGTDNAMFNFPNLFDEVQAAYEIANKFGKVAPQSILEMITLNLKKILNANCYISLAPGTPSNFMVLDIPFTDPSRSLISGIKPENIKLINIGNTIWKK